MLIVDSFSTVNDVSLHWLCDIAEYAWSTFAYQKANSSICNSIDFHGINGLA